MKNLNIFLTILIILTSLHNCYAQYEDFSQNNSYNSYSLLLQKSALYIKKHTVLIALIPIIIAYHADIFQCIINRPYISSIGLYCLLQYGCDTILHYNQQQSLLELIDLLKEITLYLVISHGIKNYIYQKKAFTEPFFDDQFFLNNITNNLNYSFHEVTAITLTSYQELKSTLESLNSHIDIESEEFVFLCYSPLIGIDNLLYLTQNNSSLHQTICDFEKDPKNNNAQLLEYVKTKITAAFIKLEKHLLENDLGRCLL